MRLEFGYLEQLVKGSISGISRSIRQAFSTLASVPGSTAIIVPRTARSAALCATALTVHAPRLLLLMTRPVSSRQLVSCLQEVVRILMNVRAIATIGRNKPHTARLTPLCQRSQPCPVSAFCDTRSAICIDRSLTLTAYGHSAFAACRADHPEGVTLGKSSPFFQKVEGEELLRCAVWMITNMIS